MKRINPLKDMVTASTSSLCKVCGKPMEKSVAHGVPVYVCMKDRVCEPCEPCEPANV